MSYELRVWSWALGVRTARGVLPSGEARDLLHTGCRLLKYLLQTCRIPAEYLLYTCRIPAVYLL
jgi:hypothetical protein